MSPRGLQISFDNSSRTYRPGETIQGQIVSPKKGIHVEIRGKALTRSDGNDQLDSAAGHQKYFLMYPNVTAFGSDEKLQLLPSGHVYVFKCVLPKNIPSSSESEFGHVKYTIQVKHSSFMRSYKIEEIFNVVSDCDPRTSKPLLLDNVKTFSCSSSPQPVIINFSSPVRGYVSGQSVPIRVNIKNASTVQYIELVLKQYVTYRTSRGSYSQIRTNESKIAEDGILIRNYGDITCDQLLKIPSLSTPNLRNCHLIGVEYRVNLGAYIEGLCDINSSKSVPVIIGTIPLNLVTSSLIPKSGEINRKESSFLEPPAYSAPPDYFEAVITKVPSQK